MPTSAKVVSAVAVALFLVLFLFIVDRGDRGPVDARFWRGGERDGLRQSIMKPDGTFRLYTQPAVVAYLATILAIIWLLL